VTSGTQPVGRAVVSGRVQGVWFRETCRREAVRRGVSGWVRNRSDGTVVIEAEGERAAVDALIAWAHRGPDRAAVAGVAVDDVRPRGQHGFQVG